MGEVEGKGDLRDLAAPLAEHLLTRGDLIVGIAGPPGAGKSTLVAGAVEHVRRSDPVARPLAISLDDVYYSRAERDALSIRFRAQPGSHDLDAARQVVAAVRRGDPWIQVPRFDHATDDRLAPAWFAGPVSLLLFEGLFVGLRDYGYEAIAEELDYLIYVDCPTPLARHRRLGREAKLRQQSNGAQGLPESAMNTFWSTVLEPGIPRWVRPIRAASNLVVVLEAGGRVVRIRQQDDTGV
jgi:pantothenate kinase-related protein Tda10